MAYSISRYLNIRSAYGPTISGDGRRLAFLSNNHRDRRRSGRSLWEITLTSRSGRTSLHLI